MRLIRQISAFGELVVLSRRQTPKQYRDVRSKRNVSGYSGIQGGTNDSRDGENQGNICGYISIFQANVETGTIFWAGDTAQAKNQSMT